MNHKILAITAILAIFGAVIGPVASVRPAQAVDGYGPNLTINYLSGITAWGDNTAATIGDTVEFYLEIHNTNVPSTAENLTVSVDLPSTPSGGTIASTARATTTSETTVSGSQTDVSDSTSIISLPGNAFLQYQTGSLKVTADLDGDGVKDYDNHVWPNDDILTGGINLGPLEGGAPADIQLSFKVDVVAGIDPNLTIKLLSANPERPADGWSDDTKADPGNDLQFYIEIHNTNVPSVAEDLKVWVDFDNLIAYASHVPYATNVSDATTVTFSSPSEMTYRSGSMKITWDKNGDGVYEYDNYVWQNDDLISSGGIVLGNLIGCNPYVIQISFRADSDEIPEEPKTSQISINKKVVWNGSEYDSIEKSVHIYDPDESVVYKIYVKNDGDGEATGVKVTDYLPAYIRDFNGRDEKEFDIGTLGAGEEWVGEYTAKIVEDIPQNDRTQENRAEVTTDNAGSDEDTAFIWINGPEILAAEVEAAVAEELPATGPAVPITLGLSGLLSFGFYLHKKLL